MKHTKHYAEGGAPCPDLIPGSLRVFNMKFCPFAQRTLLALVAKNVTFDIVNIHLRAKPSWYLELTGNGLVPYLQRDSDGCVLGESLVNMVYIDAAYQDSGAQALMAVDPWRRGQDSCLVQDFGANVIGPLHRFLYSKPSPVSPDERPAVLVKLTGGMDNLENELASRGGKFFHGDQPGFVDYSIWPWFERLPVCQEFIGTNPLTERHTKMVSWVKDMYGDRSVRAVALPVDHHKHFVTSLQNSPVPDYDYGITE